MSGTAQSLSHDAAVPDHLLRHDFQVTDLAIDLAQETASILNYGVRNISSTEVSHEENGPQQMLLPSLKEAARDSENGYPNPSAAAASSSSCSDKHQHQHPFSKSVAVMASNFMKLLPIQVPSFSTTRTPSISERTASASSEAPSAVAAAAKAKTKTGLPSEDPPVSQQIDRSDSNGSAPSSSSAGYPASPALHSSCSLGSLVGLAAGLASPASMSLLAGINYSYGAMLANCDGNYHWLDRPPLGNLRPLSSIYRRRMGGWHSLA